MLAEGAPELEVDPPGAAEVVTEEASALPSPAAGASVPSAFPGFSDADGVDAAVSSTDDGASIVMSRIVGAVDAVPCDGLACATSFEVAPVFARLCFGWSASEGERDLLRVVSASGMVAILVVFRGGPVSKVHGAKVWEGLVMGVVLDGRQCGR